MRTLDEPLRALIARWMREAGRHAEAAREAEAESDRRVATEADLHMVEQRAFER